MFKLKSALVSMLPLASLCTVLVAGSASVFGADPVPDYVTRAIGWWERPPLEFRHDADLKPGEILAFAGIRPGMKVVDIFPGSGYYTRLLSRVVGTNGKVFAVVPREQSHEGPKVVEYGVGTTQLGRLERLTAGRGTVTSQVNLSNVQVMWSNIDGQQYPNDVRYGKLAFPEMIDAFLMAYGYHILRGPEFAKVDMVDFNRVLYRNLNNGGVVVIVDNAAQRGADPKASAELNRIDPEIVKADMIAAGFVLDGENSALANANDNRLQPAVDVLMTRDGKPSDTFVLRFRKPMNAPNTNKRPADPQKALAATFENTIVSGFAPNQRLHFMHADGTYQEIARNTFDSGRWFYNVDGWNCRYRPGSKFADCHNYPNEYENRTVGEKWNNQAQREAWKKTELGANQVMVRGDDYMLLRGHDYSLVMGN